jgi:hypothetical protein
VDGLLGSAEQFLRLIDQYYTDFLKRAGDGAGRQEWLGAMNGGATREAVAEALLASDEFFADAGSQLT